MINRLSKQVGSLVITIENGNIELKPIDFETENLINMYAPKTAYMLQQIFLSELKELFSRKGELPETNETLDLLSNIVAKVINRLPPTERMYFA